MVTKIPASMTTEEVTATQISSLVNSVDTKAENADVVHVTGNETIAGVKTFSSQPVMPQSPVLMEYKASTSGTSIDFTGIPSWVKRITVIFSGASLSGSSSFLVQVGTSSGVVATWYRGGGLRATASAVAAGTFTSGFCLNNTTPGALYSGTLVLNYCTSGVLVASGIVAGDSIEFIETCAGSVGLPGTLDRIRITSVNGTDTFDAGGFSVLYE